MVAAGKGATAGVLFRNAEAIEVLRTVDTLVVDKTGTLTVGKPQLTTFIAPEMDHNEMLRLAASVERASEHPLAAAIVTGAESRGLTISPETARNHLKRIYPKLGVASQAELFALFFKALEQAEPGFEGDPLTRLRSAHDRT